MVYFNIGPPPLGSKLLSRMSPVQHLQIFPLDEPGHQEHPDWKEGEEKEREDHLDVGPRIKTKEAQSEQLCNLSIKKGCYYS